MWKYNTPDELYHYGILGMKWGHHKIQRMEAKQRQMLSDGKGLGTRKYVNLSNKLYIAKKKQELKTARKNKDSVKALNTKQSISEAKAGKKWGSNALDGNKFKSIYKVNRNSKEGRAISITSNTSAYNKERAKNSLKTVGKVGVVGLATATLWYPKVKNAADWVSSVKLKIIRYNWKTGVISGIRK